MKSKMALVIDLHDINFEYQGFYSNSQWLCGRTSLNRTNCTAIAIGAGSQQSKSDNVTLVFGQVCQASACKRLRYLNSCSRRKLITDLRFTQLQTQFNKVMVSRFKIKKEKGDLPVSVKKKKSKEEIEAARALKLKKKEEEEKQRWRWWVLYNTCSHEFGSKTLIYLSLLLFDIQKGGRKRSMKVGLNGSFWNTKAHIFHQCTILFQMMSSFIIMVSVQSTLTNMIDDQITQTLLDQ